MIRTLTRKQLIAELKDIIDNLDVDNYGDLDSHTARLAEYIYGPAVEKVEYNQESNVFVISC